MSLLTNGFVGIGTIAPPTYLTVINAIMVSNNTANGDQFIAYVNDLQYWHSGVYGSVLDDWRLHDQTHSRYAFNVSASDGSVYVPFGLHSTNSIATTVLGVNAGVNGDMTNGVATGFQAGQLTKQCYLSVFDGYSAGQQASNCYASVFNGYWAGYQATNSFNSLFSGYQAGKFATNCDNSIFAGYLCGVSANGARNSIFLGPWTGTNTARASTLLIDGAYQGTNALIYGEFDNKRIRINGVLEVTNGLFVNAFSNGVAPPTVVKQPIGLFGTLNAAITNSFVANGVYTTLTNYAGGENLTNGFTAKPGWAGGFLTNQTAGFYRIDFHATMIPGNSDVVELELFFDETGHEETAVFGSYDNPARVRTMTSNGIHWLPANTGVSLRVKNSSATAVEVWRAGLSIGTP
jgi:hypothetical protein